MSTLDKVLGIFLFAIALPFAVLMDLHWSVFLLLMAAIAVYALFMVPGARKRCNNCGYYFQLNLYEKLVAKHSTRQCHNCSHAAKAQTQEQSSTSMAAGE